MKAKERMQRFNSVVSANLAAGRERNRDLQEQAAHRVQPPRSKPAWLSLELEKAIADVVEWYEDGGANDEEGFRRLGELANELIVAGIK